MKLLTMELNGQIIWNNTTNYLHLNFAATLREMSSKNRNISNLANVNLKHVRASISIRFNQQAKITYFVK